MLSQAIRLMSIEYFHLIVKNKVKFLNYNVNYFLKTILISIAMI